MDPARSARQQLDQIEKDFDFEIREVLRRYMGARGKLNALLEVFPRLPASDRAEIGSRTNDFKARTEAIREALKAEGEHAETPSVIPVAVAAGRR